MSPGSLGLLLGAGVQLSTEQYNALRDAFLREEPPERLFGELARKGKWVLEQPDPHRPLLERCRELVDGVRSLWITDVDLADLQHRLDVAIRGGR